MTGKSRIDKRPASLKWQLEMKRHVTVGTIARWKDDEKPTVPNGLKIEALARQLQHPRSIYVLPNGDVLVVESKAPEAAAVRRPKALVMHWVESMATSGGSTGKSNRITLLRYSNGENSPMRSVLLDNLNSPFGVALVGDDLYVANTDSIVRYSYTSGDTKITAPGTVLTPLPGGPIDHHWTKSLVASRDGALPLGLAFNTGTGLADAYHSGAFIGEHGSWNRRNSTDTKSCSCPSRMGDRTARRKTSSPGSSMAIKRTADLSVSPSTTPARC